MDEGDIGQSLTGLLTMWSQVLFPYTNGFRLIYTLFVILLFHLTGKGKK